MISLNQGFQYVGIILFLIILSQKNIFEGLDICSAVTLNAQLSTIDSRIHVCWMIPCFVYECINAVVFDFR
jgi:hypothetical protein